MIAFAKRGARPVKQQPSSAKATPFAHADGASLLVSSVVRVGLVLAGMGAFLGATSLAVTLSVGQAFAPHETPAGGISPAVQSAVQAGPASGVEKKSVLSRAAI